MDIINREIESRLLHDFQNVTVSDRVFESGIIEKGKNYCSTASRFTIFFEEDGKKCEKSFFVKIPYDIQYYQVLKQCQFYAKEIHMYEVVLPIYKTLLPNESLHPEFFGTDGKDALILEDMSKCGYRMVEGYKQMDLEHSAAALKLLAKFHALSVKVRESNAKILEPVGVESLFTDAILQSEEYCQFVHGRLEKVVRRAAPTYAEEHPQVLHFLKTNSNLPKQTKHELQSANSPFNVLNHGDYHTNNIMFAHDPTGQVTNAKCVDFQVCRWGTPALDIMYFSIVCIRPEVFEKHFQDLLDTYVATLNATLEYLKCDQKLDMDILLSDIKKIKAFWLYTLLTTATLVVSNQPNGSGNGMADEYANDDNYVGLTKFWIPYFIKEGVFSQYEDVAIAIDQFICKFRDEYETTISKYDLEYDVVKPGDNYCSGIIRVNFDYQKNEESGRSSVLLKIPSLSENFKKVSPLGLYHREVYIYENFLPKLYELLDGTHFAPICHVATPTQVLVLEDLKARGYGTCDRKQQLDLDHCCAALVTLAKYHGLTVKYTQTHTLKDPLRQLPTEYSPSLVAFGKIMYDTFLQVAKSVAPESTYQKLCEYKDKLEEIWRLISRANDNCTKFWVVTHGDFWTNNILFKHDDHGRVQDTKMIDWQISRRGSPAMDLIYFLVSSVQFEIFASHRDTVLNLYVDTLNETLSRLDCNCQYTRADLDNDFNEYKVLFPFFVSGILQIIMMDRDSPVFDPARSKIISEGSYPSIASKWLNIFPQIGIA